MPTDQVPKKPSGSGPTLITMDTYHQLQQKRKQEKQQEEEKQQKRRKSDSDQGQESHSGDSNIDGHHPQPKDSQSIQSFQSNSYRTSGMSQPPLDTFDHIVNIAQATAPPMPLPLPPQQVPIPGPDLANIIFRNSTTQAIEVDAAAASQTVSKPNVSGEANTSSSHNHYQTHRKSGAGSGTQPHIRTTSPPTPVAGTPSGAHKSHNAKGPRLIHAIELIRIAGEILQL